MTIRRTMIQTSALLVCLFVVSCMQGTDDGSELTGKPEADFSLAGIDGNSLRLSDLKGKVVVVDFWATWCPPCRESLPGLDHLSGDPGLAKSGLKVLAVNSQESAGDVKRFLDANGYKMPVLLDSDGSAERAYHVTGLPTTLVIGRDGIIKYASVGFDPQSSESQLRTAIDKALSSN